MKLSEVELRHNCINCSKSVKLETGRKIGVCENVKCRLQPKVELCKEQWYLRALVGHDQEKTVHLVISHDKIMEALTLNNVNTRNLSEGIISDAFLSFPSFNMTYNKKTLVVTNIS